MTRATIQQGLTKKIVEHISESKREPKWMKEKRLLAYEQYKKARLPSWGPDLSGLDLKKLIYYIDPGIAEKTSWEELPHEIIDTFDKLGIPKAERQFLGGVGAQFDSNIVYHKLKQNLANDGVIFENMDTAVQKYPDIVEEYFMERCVPTHEHMFTMLHGAVWSGGTFIYVPKGVSVKEPLQAYFRMNHSASGQFEHTLIIADEGSEVTYIEGCSAPRYNASSLHAGCVELFVNKNATVKYISIENWSKNTYNLNTKRAIVEEGGEVHWVSGNMGSGVTMLYPSSILLGNGAKSGNTSVVFAGKGQVQDTGAKAIHIGENTKSIIRSKSVSKDGGVSNYRGLIKVLPSARGATSSMVCDSLMLDADSEANSYPAIQSKQEDVTISHEATIGRIGEEELFYLRSRGLTKDDAIRLVLHGFVEPVTKALPLEYAVEFNKLIELEIKDAK